MNSHHQSTSLPWDDSDHDDWGFYEYLDTIADPPLFGPNSQLVAGARALTLHTTLLTDPPLLPLEAASYVYFATNDAEGLA